MGTLDLFSINVGKLPIMAGTRGAKMFGIRVGKSLHADIFRAAAILGTTPTEMIRQVCREVTCDVLSAKAPDPAPLPAAVARQRIPSNLDLTTRRALRRSDQARGRMLLREKVRTTELAIDPQKVFQVAVLTYEMRNEQKRTEMPIVQNMFGRDKIGIKAG